MKTRYKLFLVYLLAVALLLILLSLTYHRWFETQKQTIFEANAQVAKSTTKTIEPMLVANYQSVNLPGFDSAIADLPADRSLFLFNPQSSLVFTSKKLANSTQYENFNQQFKNIWGNLNLKTFQSLEFFDPFSQKPQLATLAPVGNTGWFVIISVDKSLALGSIYQLLRWQIPLIIILVIIITIVVPFLFNRWILLRIHLLTLQTQKITKGELDNPITSTSRGEIGSLAENLESMRRELKKRITQLVKAKDEAETISQKDEAILTSIGDGVCAIDTKGKIILFNDAAREITGFINERVIGTRFQDIIQFGFEEDLTPNNQFIQKALKDGENTKMTNHTVLIGKHVRVIPVEAGAAPIKTRSGRIIGAIIVFRDVSHERKLENIKEDFFRISSHELKTPMSIINGYVDMILRGDAGKISQKTREYLQEITQVVKRQLALVNDLLSVSRFESARIAFNLQPVQLADEFKKVLEELTPQAKEKGLRINVDRRILVSQLPKVQADPQEVRLMFVNFLGNAIKFTEKGKIDVGVKEEKDRVIILVSDTGPGVEEEYRRALFRRFSQFGAVLKRKSGGTGLGLFITKFVAQRMGGDAWLESSKVGYGSTFAFSLPIVGSKDAQIAKAQLVQEKKARDELEKIRVKPGSFRSPPTV